jgi:hypothetical protein
VAFNAMVVKLTNHVYTPRVFDLNETNATNIRFFFFFFK